MAGTKKEVISRFEKTIHDIEKSPAGLLDGARLLPIFRAVVEFLGTATQETLVRQSVHFGPDGQGVTTAEVVKVEVLWPEGKKPEDSGSHYRTGSWTIAENDHD